MRFGWLVSHSKLNLDRQSFCEQDTKASKSFVLDPPPSQNAASSASPCFLSTANTSVFRARPWGPAIEPPAPARRFQVSTTSELRLGLRARVFTVCVVCR
jgi:hypothetical protein